jgi:hypothetical protein
MIFLNFGKPGGSRTHKTEILSLRCLPIASPAQIDVITLATQRRIVVRHRLDRQKCVSTNYRCNHSSSLQDKETTWARQYEEFALDWFSTQPIAKGLGLKPTRSYCTFEFWC